MQRCATPLRVIAVRMPSSSALWTWRWSRDALVIDRDVHKEFRQIDVLLILSANQVMKRMPGDGEHRLAVALRVVEPIQ